MTETLTTCPEPLELAGYEGTLSDYLNALFAEYSTMLDRVPRLWGRRLLAPRTTTADGRERLFWHLVTNGSSDGARRLHPGRACRLPQVRYVLEQLASGGPDVVTWREGCRILASTRGYEVVVILVERQKGIQFATAFPGGRSAANRHVRALRTAAA
jgi:hypothetical protein